jgi:hypothetical protein
VARNAFTQFGQNIVAGLHPVHQRVTKYVSVRRIDSAIAAAAIFTNIYQTRGQLPHGTGR